MRRTKVRAAAMAEIRRDFGERVHERGGNGQEVRRRDQGALMRTSAHGREARFAAEMELPRAAMAAFGRVRAEKKGWGRKGRAPLDLDPTVGEAGWRGCLGAVRFKSDSGEREGAAAGWSGLAGPEAREK